MERKGQRNTRRQRRSRSWLFSPFIIAQLALVMVLAGVGVSFALTDTTVGTTQGPWAGNAAITDGELQVTNYVLVFSSDLTTVTGVTLSLSNIDTVDAHTGTAQVVIGGVSGTPTAISSIAASGTGSVTVNIGPMALSAVTGTMRILVTAN